MKKLLFVFLPFIVLGLMGCGDKTPTPVGPSISLDHAMAILATEIRNTCGVGRQSKISNFAYTPLRQTDHWLIKFIVPVATVVEGTPTTRNRLYEARVFSDGAVSGPFIEVMISWCR